MPAEMNRGTRRPLDDGIDDGIDEEILASGSITPDAFLAEVARIPGRGSQPADPPLEPGQAVGHFVIRRELGRGGMGVVYEADDTTLGRLVALKVLPRADDEGRRKRFLREARAAALVSHPGIAVIYEIGEVAGRVYIAMELVRGETLRARLRGGGLAIEEAWSLAREIARALSRAHERGVVHRDLKPENVMIDEHGQIKLLDFGLAKPIAADDLELGTATTATEHGRVLGTPTYMSPEQAKGREVEAPSDVFSFGVMLYEMLTGQRPFSGRTVVELFIALDRDEPTPPSRRNTRVPAELERVVLRCLRKDPAARYADAGALLRDLEPPAAGPRPTFPRAARIAAVIAAILAVVIAASIQRQSPPAPAARRVITDRPTPKSKSPEAVAAYRKGLEGMRAGSAETRGLARAIELDPDFAAAHVQLATIAMGHATEPAREHFRQASARRADLEPRDLAILDAIEPLVQRQPADWAETNRRLAAAIEQSPGDAELWYLLGLGRANYDDFEAAVSCQKKAIELDPGFSHAYSTMAMYLAYLGRFDEALGVAQQGLAITPTSAACMKVTAMLHEKRGQCAEMEGMARRMIAAGVPAPASYFTLAQALAARNGSPGSVREALKQAEQGLADLPASLVSETVRKQRRLGLSWAIADLEGDFEASERIAREYAPTIEGSTAQSERGALAWRMARIYLETGRDADAGRVAADYLDRRDAWEPAPGAEDVAMAGDATPFLLLTALRTGAITRADFEARRASFRRTWRARMTPVTRAFLWVHGYAAMVDGEADAREALAALPELQPLPPFQPESRAETEVGRTFLLGGRVDEAITSLERAAANCGVLHLPAEHVHVLLALGDARAVKGDVAGACAAYAGVLARWDRARPRSVSAERARAQRKALGCSGS